MPGLDSCGLVNVLLVVIVTVFPLSVAVWIAYDVVPGSTSGRYDWVAALKLFVLSSTCQVLPASSDSRNPTPSKRRWSSASIAFRADEPVPTRTMVLFGS